MIKQFHNLIVDKLKTIPEIKQVDFAYNNDSNVYPEACVMFEEMSEEYETQMSVRRVYSYNIRLETLRGGKDRNQVYADFEDLVMLVLNNFGRNSIKGATLTRPTGSAIYEEVQQSANKIIGTISVQIENIERVQK